MKLKTAIFVLMTILSASAALAELPQQFWTRIAIPEERQTSQIEAGYQNGCEITAMLYALKFGPTEWHSAYNNIAGDTDLQKIQALAGKFGSMPSRKSKGLPAFSEKSGTNPNDVPWMIQSLTQGKVSLSLANYFYLPPQANASEKGETFKKFHLDLSKRLEVGQPVPMDLYFSNPVFAHAVLVTGVSKSIDSNDTIKIQILDPATGKASEASVHIEAVTIAGNNMIGISFYGPDVVDNKGIVISVQL